MTKVNTYGLKFGDAIVKSPNAALHIELYCFRVDHKTNGGLGAYRHFRNVCSLLWPKMEWHPWIVYAHVLGAFAFAAGHGVAATMAFRLRSERDPSRIAAILDY